MARPRYQITATDLTHAWQYLSDRVQLQLIELEDESKREFWDIRDSVDALLPPDQF